MEEAQPQLEKMRTSMHVTRIQEDARKRLFLIGTNTYMASPPKAGYVDHCRKDPKYYDYVCCKIYQALSRVEAMLPDSSRTKLVTSVWASDVDDEEKEPIGQMLKNLRDILRTYVGALA